MRSHLHCRVENQWGSLTTLNIGPIMWQPLYYVTTHGDTFRREEWIRHSALLGQCRNTGFVLRRVFYNKIKHKEIEFDSVWIQLSHNWWPWWALMSFVTTFGFPARGGICSPGGFSARKLAWYNSSTRDVAISRPSPGLTFIHCRHQLGYKPN
jgi:hypothetical protein